MITTPWSSVKQRVTCLKRNTGKLTFVGREHHLDASRPFSSSGLSGICFDIFGQPRTHRSPKWMTTCHMYIVIVWILFSPHHPQTKDKGKTPLEIVSFKYRRPLGPVATVDTSPVDDGYHRSSFILCQSNSFLNADPLYTLCKSYAYLEP